VSARMEEQRRMQESASCPRLSRGECLYGLINLHTYVHRKTKG